MFAELPSQARTKFNNNPATFLDFVQDPEKQNQLYELGLSDFPLESPTPDKPAIVNETQ